jgi:hypothetical protein
VINLADIMIIFFLPKDKVEKGETPVPDKECAYHHIIPNNELETLIPPNSEPIEDRKKELGEYLNNPHIKSVILDNNLINNPDNDHGEIIHAAISNNPHNLVNGSKKEYRSNDPGRGQDTEILNAQAANYQAAVNTYAKNKSLQEFGNLPPTTPVEWEHTGSKKIRKEMVDQYEVKKLLF